MQKRFPSLFLILAFVLLLKVNLFAQEKNDYRGAWLLETSEGEELVLIVKRNQLASFFRLNNADNTVYQGTWVADDESIVLSWEDGSTHRIERNALNYSVTHTAPSEELVYTRAVRKLPDDILGQWAREPSSREDAISDRDKAKGFFGTWKVESKQAVYYVVVESDRFATSNWNQSELYGSWAKQGSELHIAWDNGHYGILRQNERTFTYQVVESGTAIDGSTSGELIANRISPDSSPEELQVLHADRELAQIGKDRNEVASFYRGSWIIQRSNDNFERIDIGRFGGLKTSADSTLYGNWSLSGRDIFMNWDDGTRKILRSIGSGFLLYEYKPGRPTDGVPTHVYPATPGNIKKLARYSEDNWGAARQLLSLAKAVEANQENVALIETEKNPLNTGDPWWWPLWSENSTDEQRYQVAIEPSTEKAENVAQPEITERTKSVPKPNWEWPF